MPSLLDGEPGCQVHGVSHSSPGTTRSVVAVMSSSPTKDREKAVVVAVDEVELARMGYKQELKSVHTHMGNAVC